MNGPERTTHPHRFLLIWGALAALNFVIAAVLTGIVVEVSALEAPYHSVGMYGAYRSHAVGWVYYYGGAAGGRYLIYYPAHTTSVALPTGKFTDCIYNQPPQRRVLSSDVTTSSYQGRSFYLIRLSPSPHGAATNGEVTCRLDFAPTRTSFTDYAMDIWFLPYPPKGSVSAATLNYYVQFDGAENMQVFGARATSSSSAALEPDDESVIRFTDVRRQSLREIMFVVIGTLVAFGAALSLEAIRPYVERAASGHQK